MSDNFMLDIFRAMGANVTSDAEYEVPAAGDMTISGDIFKSYHPNIPDGNMTKVIVPDGIKIIDKEAFMGPDKSHNHYLECCRLPEGVTTIKKEAFALCASLNEIELPSTLNKIESGVFMYSGLRKIELPEGLESIGDGAFQNCRSIKELRIPSTVRKIGNYCFSQMGVPLMDNDQPGAKIIAPSHLKELYDKEYLDDLFYNHEVEWYSSELKPDTIEPDQFECICGFIASGDKKCNIEFYEDGKINAKLLIYQFAKVLSLLGDLNIDRSGLALLLIEGMKDYSKLADCKNPNSRLILTVFTNSNGDADINVDDSEAEPANLFMVIYTCIEMLRSMKVDDDVIQYIIMLYFNSEDYDDFVSALSEMIPDDSDNGKTMAKPSTKASTTQPSYPKTFTIRGNKLVKYTGKAYTVDVPDCVEIIGAGAFEGNQVIREIKIREGVKKIESNALADLHDYCDVYLPQSLDDIAGDAFGDRKDEVLKAALFGDFKYGRSMTVYAVKGSLAYGTAEALKLPVKECKPSDVAKKKKREKAVTEFKVSADTSEASKKYFDKFKQVSTPKTKRKLFDKYASRLTEENPLGCDLMIKNLYEYASTFNKDYPRKAKIIDDYSRAIADDDRGHIVGLAEEYSKLFMVDEASFNPKSDRCAEIHKGYIKHVSMIHHYMSFVYNVTEYCSKQKKEINDLTLEEIIAVSDFIDSCGGTCYKSCSRLTGFNEKNYYVYETNLGKKLIQRYGVGFKIDYENTAALSVVCKELVKFENLIKMIFEYLEPNRDSSIPLTGTLADILAIWCTFAFASVNPFIMVDGLKDYDLKPYEDGDFVIPENAASLAEEKDGYIIIEDILLQYVGDDTTITLPDGINITSQNNLAKNKNVDTFIFPKSVNVYPGGRYIYVPNEVKTVEFTADSLVIEDNAFKHVVFECDNKFKNVILPEGTTSIGKNAFYNVGSRDDRLLIRIPESVKTLYEDSFTPSDTEFIVYYNSVAEGVLKKHNDETKYEPNKFKYTSEYSEAQKEQMRREAEEKERLRKEAEAKRKAEEEEKERLRKEAEAKRKAEEEEKERLRKEAEAKRKAEEEARKAEEARIAEEKRKNKYSAACNQMASISFDSDIESIVKEFVDLGDYSDSMQKAKECRSIYDECCNNKKYNDAVSLMKIGNVKSYKKAVKMFNSLDKFKDSETLSAECTKKYTEIKKKKRKKNLIIFLVVFALLIAIFAWLDKEGQVIIEEKYQKSVAYMEEGKYEEAYDLLKDIKYTHEDEYQKARSELIKKAKAYEEEGKYDEAIVIYEKIGDTESLDRLKK